MKDRMLPESVMMMPFKSSRSPTIPIFKLLEGRPNTAFFSAAPAFFGGILFLMSEGDVQVKLRKGVVLNKV